MPRRKHTKPELLSFDDQDHWANRITRYSEEPPGDLIANPMNFRHHPSGQQRALSGAMSEIGWIQDIVVNETTGRIIDGHLRVELAIKHGEERVPVKWVTLSEEEELKAIATLDPLSAMAFNDRDIYADLIARVKTDSVDLRDMMSSLLNDAEDLETEESAERTQKPEDLPPELMIRVMEHHDYVVLLFRHQLDWIGACELFGLGSVHTDTGSVSVGIGRVIDGAQALRIIREQRDASDA